MKTIRILLGLTGLLTILAITATPAAAEFEADQANTTQGPYQLTGTAPVFTAPGGQEVTCSTLKNGVWHEQTKFTKITVTNGITEVKQDQTKRGPHQAITGQFEGCTALGTVEAKVNSTCALQIEQHSTKEFKGSVISRCVIAVPFINCEISIAAGNPNTQLSEVKSINVEKQNKEDVSNVSGITSTVTAGCASGGITAGNTNKFKGTGIAHSQKVF